MLSNTPSKRRIDTLLATTSLKEFAPLIGFTPKGLAYVLHGVPRASRYRTFSIPKASGGIRVISAPDAQLALAQRRLADLLQDCMEEIASNEPSRRTLSHGYRRGRSIVTNADVHRRRRYVLNLDLEDFFGSINFGRVRGFFIGDTRFALPPAVATVIAQIACHDNALPQGSPCSPVISNLIGHILDVRLARLTKTHRVRVTRYVDDISISTNEKTFPAALAAQVGTTRRWTLGEPLIQTIQRAGFAVNHAKTRMQVRGSRQLATGLIVNDIVNAPIEHVRATRAMCASLFRTGAYHHPTAPSEAITERGPLEGRLAHTFYVKRRRDLGGEEANPIRAEMGLRHASIDLLYRRFLIHKHCVAATKAMLITEGKTDIIYLRCAMRALAASFPRLAPTTTPPRTWPIGFVPPSYVSQAVLGLCNGYGGMTAFVSGYDKALKRYTHAPLAHPVIFVVDNDTGGKQLFGRATGPGGAKVDFETSTIWHPMGHNLYLLRTPPRPGAASAKGAMSDMEDLFMPATLETRLDGKPFDKTKKHGDAMAYGKARFADRVVRPGIGRIDFSGFAPMLQGIIEIIDDYAAKLAAQATAPALATSRP